MARLRRSPRGLLWAGAFFAGVVALALVLVLSTLDTSIVVTAEVRVEPLAVRASHQGDAAALDWSPEPAVTYLVSRAGELLASTASGSFLDASPPSGQSSYEVTEVRDGVVVARGTATLEAAAPPAGPRGHATASAAGGVDLAWERGGGGAPAGFVVYRSDGARWCSLAALDGVAASYHDANGNAASAYAIAALDASARPARGDAFWPAPASAPVDLPPLPLAAERTPPAYVFYVDDAATNGTAFAPVALGAFVVELAGVESRGSGLTGTFVVTSRAPVEGPHRIGLGLPGSGVRMALLVAPADGSVTLSVQAALQEAAGSAPGCAPDEFRGLVQVTSSVGRVEAVEVRKPGAWTTTATFARAPLPTDVIFLNVTGLAERARTTSLDVAFPAGLLLGVDGERGAGEWTFALAPGSATRAHVETTRSGQDGWNATSLLVTHDGEGLDATIRGANLTAALSDLPDRVALRVVQGPPRTSGCTGGHPSLAEVDAEASGGRSTSGMDLALTTAETNIALRAGLHGILAGRVRVNLTAPAALVDLRLAGNASLDVQVPCVGTISGVGFTAQGASRIALAWTKGGTAILGLSARPGGSVDLAVGTTCPACAAVDLRASIADAPGEASLVEARIRTAPGGELLVGGGVILGAHEALVARGGAARIACCGHDVAAAVLPGLGGAHVLRCCRTSQTIVVRNLVDDETPL